MTSSVRQRFPFLRPGLAVGIGCAIGAWLGLSCVPTRFAVSATVAALVACGLAAVLVRTRVFLQRLGFIGFFIAAGFAAGLGADKGDPISGIDAAADAPVRFVGRIAEPLDRHLAAPRWRHTDPQARLTLVIDIDAIEIDHAWKPLRRRALLGAEDVPIDVGVGDDVFGSCLLFVPEPPANPGQPDQRPYLRRHGISYVGALVRGAIAATSISTGIERRSERFREAFTAFARSEIGDDDRAALVAALAVGERSGVSVDLADAFNTSGLAHVLSISGLHLAVAVGALWWALRRLLAMSGTIAARIAPGRLAAIIALPMTAGYVALIGAPAPAIRAGLGLGLVLLGRALGREGDVLNTLGWSLAAILFFDPASIDEASTQLSFMGVVGIVYFTPRIRALIPLKPAGPAESRWLRAREEIVLLLAGTIGATLATAPLTAIYFERASLVAALANLAAWPFSAFIVPSGALSAALFWLWKPLAVPLVHVAGWCAWGLSFCARFFASWPAAAVRVAPPTPVEILGYASVVIALANIQRWQRGWTITSVATGAAMMVASSYTPTWPKGRMEITFLSVGQGDSTVIRLPQGGTMVVDAGGNIAQRFDPGVRVVAPFLRSEGVRKIDLLVATHPHPDHIGGMPALFQRLGVSEFWENGEGVDSVPMAALDSIAREHGTPVTTFPQAMPAQCDGLPPLEDALPDVAKLAVGDPRCTKSFPERDIEGVHFQVLHPLNGPTTAHFPELGENDNSLVLRLTYGRVHVLLTGDVEREGESILLARGVDLSADIEKAPHHGSGTSSTDAFVQAVHPKYVVFCVGERNQFGFPNPEIESRYAQAGCQRFRTDRDGAVTFVTDGEKISVQKFLKSSD